MEPNCYKQISSDRYGCSIVMSYIVIDKAWHNGLTFVLCVSVIQPLTCVFYMCSMHTPKNTDLHRVACDNITVTS